MGAISSNTNSFGLSSFMFIALDGEAWTGCKAKQYTSMGVGREVVSELPIDEALTDLGFELVEQLPDCPPEAVREVWGVSQH